MEPEVCFVEVRGHIEVIVCFHGSGDFHLSVADVPDTARGGSSCSRSSDSLQIVG